MGDDSMDDVQAKVLEIIAQQKRIPVEKVTIDSSFDELGMDSLDAVNILFELEGAFEISIPDEKARGIKSVREMVEGVRSLVAEKKSA
jgi:acyl carrier protein